MVSLGSDPLNLDELEASKKEAEGLCLDFYSSFTAAWSHTQGKDRSRRSVKSLGLFVQALPSSKRLIHTMPMLRVNGRLVDSSCLGQGVSPTDVPSLSSQP